MRSGRLIRVVVVASVALSAAATVFAWVVIARSLDLATPDSWGFRGFATIFAVTFTWVGAALVWRRPRNAVGWLLLVIGVTSATQAFGSEYAFVGTVGRATPLPGAVFSAWVVGWMWVAVLTLTAVFLPLLFPDGHFVSARWRVVAWIGGICAAATSLGLAFDAGPMENAPFVNNPYALFDAPQSEVLYAPLAGVAAAGFGAAASMFFRYRRSRGAERQQLKWLAFEAVLLAVALVVGSFDPNGGEAAKWKSAFLIGAVALMPVMVGIAVLRYRLYDIDVLINRALVYGATTAAIGAAFFGGIVVLQAALRPVTGGSELAVAGSTLVSFALFQPVRGRLQLTVDRRFYRSRYDAGVVLDRFAEEIANEVDLGAVRASLVAAVGETLQPAHVGLWLRGAPR